jgi:peptidoglycan hydrolase-like protein with peptidoglycan-binding domain
MIGASVVAAAKKAEEEQKLKAEAEAKAKALAEKKKKENADLVAKNNSNPTLKKGDKNDNVKVLQTKLNLAADGSFGNKTYEAVKAFQSKNGLTSDGVVGKGTWDKLNGITETKRILDAFPITREVAKPTSLVIPTNLNINKLSEIQRPQLPEKLPDIAGNGFTDTLKAGGQALGAGVTAGIGSIKDSAVGAYNQTKDQIKGAVSGIKDAAKNLQDSLPKQLPKVEIPKIELPKIPKFKKKEIPEPNKVKKKKLKDKLAALKAQADSIKKQALEAKAKAEEEVAKVKLAAKNAQKQITDGINKAKGSVSQLASAVAGPLTQAIAIANNPQAVAQALAAQTLATASEAALTSAKGKFDSAKGAMSNARSALEATSKTNDIQYPAGLGYIFKEGDRGKKIIDLYKDGKFVTGISFNKLTVEEDAKIELIAQNKSSYPNIINKKKIA